MAFIRTYIGPDGASRMDEPEVAYTAIDAFPGHPKIEMALAGDARNVRFGRLPAGWEAGWHPAPERRFVITLAGAAEIATEDGQRRVMRAGDVALFDDTTGRGHHTTVLPDAAWDVVFVNLPG